MKIIISNPSGGVTDHTLLTNIGTNTHAQIDTHIDSASIHFTVASISHTSISNIGTNTHGQIDTHISSASIHFTEAGIDHGSIAGLTDDDHPQYLNLSQTETISVTNNTISALTINQSGNGKGLLVEHLVADKEVMRIKAPKQVNWTGGEILLKLDCPAPTVLHRLIDAGLFYVDMRPDTSVNLSLNGGSSCALDIQGGTIDLADGGISTNPYAAGDISLTPKGGKQVIVKGPGVLALNEATVSPAINTGSGMLYTKSDNNLYFKDGDGSEHTVSFV